MTGVTLTNRGAGYLTAPALTILPNPADPNLLSTTAIVNATATAVLIGSGSIAAVICTNPGAPVTTAPTLTTGGTSTVTVDLNGATTNGNVTGLVDRLVEQGLIDRRKSPEDRRAQIVSLTAEGRRLFRAMARANEQWIGEMFADLSNSDIETLLRLLAKAKLSVRAAIGRA